MSKETNTAIQEDVQVQQTDISQQATEQKPTNSPLKTSTDTDFVTDSDISALERLSKLMADSQDDPAVLNMTSDEFQAWEAGSNNGQEKNKLNDDVQDNDNNVQDNDDDVQDDSNNVQDDSNNVQDYEDGMNSDGNNSDDDEEEQNAQDTKEEPEKNVIPEWVSESIKDFMEEGETPQETLAKVVQKTKELEQTLKEEEEANEAIIKLFDANPEIKDVVRLLHKGYTMNEALVTVLDLDELAAIKEDPKAQEKLIEKRIRREYEQEQLRKQAEENHKISQQNLDEFYTENNMDEKAKENFSKKMNAMIEPLFKGIVTKELLSALAKGLNFEKAVQTAAEKAKIETMNTKVQKEITKRKGDGLPNAGSRRSSDQRPSRAEEFISRKLITDGEWA